LQADSGEEALALVEQCAPDLLLLDIRMPGMDGIDVATALDDMARPPAIIFCTAYDEYALEALQHQAMAYLLKPVREAELAKALDGAHRVNRLQLASLRPGESAESGQSRSQVSSQTHRGLETMPLADVRCFVAEQKYVTAFSTAAELLIPDTLKDLEQEFSSQFVRVHRNALVALAHIVRLERAEGAGWQVVLDGVGERPVVSRRHLADVKQRLVER
jgi:two-component system response regulator AlgR